MLGAQQDEAARSGRRLARRLSGTGLTGSMVDFFAGCGVMRAALPHEAAPFILKSSTYIPHHSAKPAGGARIASKQKLELSGAAACMPCPDLPTCAKSAWKPHLANPATPLSLANWKAARSSSWHDTDAGTSCCLQNLNFRANIYALKKLGVERILSVSAVGSLKEEHKPTDFVIPDQFIDRTFHRESTFFRRWHCGPCRVRRSGVRDGGEDHRRGLRASEVVGKAGGTYVCMEGPQFSTRAESNLYRSWGADVIGMTNLQEAKLAREAEICYATMAMVTDYDCWHEGHDDVTVEQIVAVLQSECCECRPRWCKAAVAAMPERPNLRLCVGAASMRFSRIRMRFRASHARAAGSVDWQVLNKRNGERITDGDSGCRQCCVRHH